MWNLTKHPVQPESLAGKKVVVLGLGRQGMALVRFLTGEQAHVLVSDLRNAEALRDNLAALEDLCVQYVLGGHPQAILDGADLVCVSGGVPMDAPIVQEAARRGIVLSNDVQLFLERCPAPVIGITGSSGKTTTTSLVGRMLQRGRFRTLVGGNIGRPLVNELWDMVPEDRVALELSSFQLELMTVSPEIAAVLNVTPNHLDRHKSMALYTAAKRRILDFQSGSDLAVLGQDDPGARRLGEEVQGTAAYFSGRDAQQGPIAGLTDAEMGAYLRRGVVTVRLAGQEHAVCHTSEIKLLGQHNVLNLLAACVLAGAAGVAVEVMREVAITFTGVAHRLELVRTLNGVRYYDDSIATAPERTVAALKAFNAPVVLLAGGRDKHLPWEELAHEAQGHVRQVVAFGEAAELVERVMEKARRRESAGSLQGVTRVETLEEAVAAAARLAQAGDVVLLAPGGTSFDAFRDFEERGDMFQALVRAL
jgi:UDP-N-acetylmuramoylalanine--D-glutamate ligase